MERKHTHKLSENFPVFLVLLLSLLGSIHTVDTLTYEFPLTCHPNDISPTQDPHKFIFSCFNVGTSDSTLEIVTFTNDFSAITSQVTILW